MAINSITGKNLPPITTGSTGKDKKSDGVFSSANTNKVERDSFDPTAVSQRIKQALESDPATPVLNEEKITAVREALKQGNYQINADSIAEKMLQFDNPFNSA